MIVVDTLYPLSHVYWRLLECEGKITPGYEVRVVDDDGKGTLMSCFCFVLKLTVVLDVEPHEPGELLVKGPMTASVCAKVHGKGLRIDNVNISWATDVLQQTRCFSQGIWQGWLLSHRRLLYYGQVWQSTILRQKFRSYPCKEQDRKPSTKNLYVQLN